MIQVVSFVYIYLYCIYYLHVHVPIELGSEALRVGSREASLKDLADQSRRLRGSFEQLARLN